MRNKITAALGAALTLTALALAGPATASTASPAAPRAPVIPVQVVFSPATASAQLHAEPLNSCQPSANFAMSDDTHGISVTLWANPCDDFVQARIRCFPPPPQPYTYAYGPWVIGLSGETSFVDDYPSCNAGNGGTAGSPDQDGLRYSKVNKNVVNCWKLIPPGLPRSGTCTGV